MAAIYIKGGSGGGASKGALMAFYARGNGNSSNHANYATVEPDWTILNADYINVSGSDFVIQKNCDITFRYGCRGAYNNQGETIEMRFRVRVNGTEVFTKTNVSNTGAYGSFNLTMYAGDVMNIQSSNILNKASYHDVAISAELLV